LAWQWQGRTSLTHTRISHDPPAQTGPHRPGYIRWSRNDTGAEADCLCFEASHIESNQINLEEEKVSKSDEVKAAKLVINTIIWAVMSIVSLSGMIAVWFLFDWPQALALTVAYGFTVKAKRPESD
jgi:hypothetical protein